MPDALVFDLPMRVRFRGQERRSGVLIPGAAGWGEWAPFPEYDVAEAARWLRAAREAAEVGWPAPRRERIAVNTTVPAVDPVTAHRLVAQSGCGTAKVKVAERGQTLHDDVERVAAVRDALGAAGRVRVDANGAWSLDEAEEALQLLKKFDLEYAEQPVATLEEMADLRRRVDVRIAADESVRKASDPRRIAGLDAADIVMLKVAPIGGVQACLDVAAACGLPVVVSSAIDTSIGLAAGLALAGALPELEFACGLGTVTLIDGDVCSDSLRPVGGSLPVRTSAPQPDRYDEFRAGPELTDWWLARLGACEKLLGDG